MKKPFKLAMVQMLVEGGLKDANLTHAEALIGEAVREGAQLAYFRNVLILDGPIHQVRPMPNLFPEGCLLKDFPNRP